MYQYNVRILCILLGAKKNVLQALQKMNSFDGSMALLIYPYCNTFKIDFEYKLKVIPVTRVSKLSFIFTLSSTNVCLPKTLQ